MLAAAANIGHGREGACFFLSLLHHAGDKYLGVHIDATAASVQHFRRRLLPVTA